MTFDRRARDRRETGLRGEDAVARYLEAQGFAILARNLRLGRLEIDLLARKGPLVAIVEVRARAARGLVGPFASVTPTKRAALLRAAERVWRERLRAMSGVERVRIDVAGVTMEADGSARVDYAPGAITA